MKNGLKAQLRCLIMINKNVPEIRFPEFTDDWELRKLGNIVQITMGQSPNSENYTENPSDYILVQGNADMKNNKVVPRVWTTQVTKKADIGDLILSVRAPVGDVGKTDYDVVLGRGVASIKGNEFIFQTLGRMKENGFWTKLSTGSTFESINSSDIKDASILLPNEDEQIKIGTFFQQLDYTIALHQHKLNILKQTKQGLLKKMFPKEGESVPELRFPGFTDAWELRKFTDIVDRVNLSSNSNQLPKVEFEDIAAGEGRLNKDITNKLDSRKGTIFQPNNILYGKLRPYLKNWLQPSFKGIALGDFWVFEAKNTDAKFDYYLIQADKYQKVANDTSGTKMPRSDWKLVSNTLFLIPKKDEQTKIGEFFKQLDNTIALHQRELDILKETKKGFLQKLFV
ncbi:restriction endonuclease subunit S [Carnobacterium maltaromaticum]|nr:restriction endonuclease subunit S [Carnobacterium maltaromaticum]MDT2000419.1 restriction endonuclease subunit S [Carnobacterium maltaromaticum]